MAAAATSIPCLDLTSDPKTLERGSEEWKAMSQRVCEALETHGCMIVEGSKITSLDQEEMLKAMRSFFDLPLETRPKHSPSDLIFIQMDETGAFPVYENTGVYNAMQPDKAKAFTDTVWPGGNQAFCETLNTTSKKMLELAKTLMNMICDAFVVELEAESPALTEEAGFQMIRYAAPMNDNKAVTGAQVHADGGLLTILFQNEVEGLKVQFSKGEWHEVKLGGGGLIVLAGQTLRAWSNGQFHAVPHKVDLSGYKDRFSFGLFWSPKEDKIIQAHPKFVNKQRPLLYKPFVVREFFKYLKENGYGAKGIDFYACRDAKGGSTANILLVTVFPFSCFLLYGG